MPSIVQLSEEEFSKCMDWGLKVHRLKNKFSSTNNLVNNSHGLGKLGELAFAKFCPLVDENSVDWKIQTGGDKLDFLGKIDIKTTTYHKYPELKENANKTVSKLTWFVLAAIDVERKQVKIVGYIASTNFLNRSNFYDNYRGLGSRYVVQGYKLSQNWELLWECLKS